jgi:hypothetical protein
VFIGLDYEVNLKNNGKYVKAKENNFNFKKDNFNDD